MKRRQQTSQPNQDATHCVERYARLENRLILLAWLNQLLGYSSNRDLLEDCKNEAEGFNADGRSFLYHHFIAHRNKLKISIEKLAEYDENIRLHLEKINRNRTEKITLRYFQYLAALYTEIILDCLFSDKAQLLAELNRFVEERNKKLLLGEPRYDKFTEKDLTKLAFWMATGSGKTLLLHLNYYQFLHYKCKHDERLYGRREPLNKILLITPNEGLSEQHLRELIASGIPARRFQGNLDYVSQDVIDVIEITKLVDEKRGDGESVLVESFEGRNLIFVDEGHKGARGEVWRHHRNKLGENGFTFEYSATFGQALSAADDDELTREYGKAIVFDYSYKYFYGDGFGKDFRILNLKDKTDDEKTELILLGNLLSFYEQVRLFEEQRDALRPYHLEKPLWVFVGSAVNAVYTENKKPRSDVLTVVRFLHRVLSERVWAVGKLTVILEGKTGLVDAGGTDIFASRFSFLKEKDCTSEQLYDDILVRIFHAQAGGGLHLCDVKSSPGELGLRAAGAKEYFGVIYIGDKNEFKKLVEGDQRGMTLEDDVISPSLFGRIDSSDSKIHVLIGARKFMEGWNSWRVTSMGLLNIGRQEGSQIIQLFGRGVRLKGKDMSLKRSSALGGTHPQHIRLLETLNIFAVRANYMAQFREYLEREGVDVEPANELPLFVRVNEQFLGCGLVVPRPSDGRDFVREASLLLEPDASIAVQADLSVRVQTIESTGLGMRAIEVRSGQARPIPADSLAWVDWSQVYLDLLAYKRRRGLTNLVIQPETLPRIVSLRNANGIPLCTVIADENVFAPQSFKDRLLLQQAVTQLLCRYVDKFYRIHREGWEEKTMNYHRLDASDPNLVFRPHGVREGKAGYMVRIPHSEEQLMKAVRDLLNNEQSLYERDGEDLRRIYFDRHLYQPLLVDMSKAAQSLPSGLKKSEADFVRDLRVYWNAEKGGALKGREIFLLRNLSRGRGIGFFEERGFYPDFILWVKWGDHQRVVFIEPHGMMYAKAYIHDEKARLHERLPELAKAIGERSGRNNVSLDAFIISATSYEDLYQRYDDGTWTRDKFRDKHILFPVRTSDYDYIKIILSSEDGSASGVVS